MALALASGVACGDAYPPLPQALAALASDERVRVSEIRVPGWGERGYWAFEPATRAPAAGLVFYPGAFVDPRSYAPPMRALAEAGHLAAIVPMPEDFALLGTERAAEVQADWPEVEAWAIAGHSLGGVAATVFASADPWRVAGVALWASYPQESSRLDATGLAVTSIYGSRDGITVPSDVLTRLDLLPADATLVEIAGGNHTQFGWYGPKGEVQEGDLEATIGRPEQQALTVDAALELLRSMSRGGARE